MINKSSILELTEIRMLYEQAFEFLEESKSPPEIEIRFYPYVSVNHTIRVRRGKVFVRVSDLFKHVPFEVHKALAFILVAKLLDKPVPVEARRFYRNFVNDKEFQDVAIENKRRKGRKVITSAIGEFCNLEHIFGKLNLIYFQNEIPKPKLTWSRSRSYRRLGHFDKAHNSITISKALDDSYVPKFVVEYVVYHEMLHIKHPTQHRNGRRYNHTPAFKRDEEKFAYFDEAEDWIEDNSAKLKRKSKQKG
jgi:hypothetical protein